MMWAFILKSSFVTELEDPVGRLELLLRCINGALQTFKFLAIDARHWEIVVRHWKIWKFVIVVDLHISLSDAGRLPRTRMPVVGQPPSLRLTTLQATWTLQLLWKFAFTIANPPTHPPTSQRFRWRAYLRRVVCLLWPYKVRVAPKPFDVAVGRGESQKMGVELMCGVHIDNQIL